MKCSVCSKEYELSEAVQLPGAKLRFQGFRVVDFKCSMECRAKAKKERDERRRSKEQLKRFLLRSIFVLLCQVLAL